MDRWGGQGQDQGVESARASVRDLEMGRDRAGGRHQDLMNSFRLEVPKGTGGCLTGPRSNTGSTTEAASSRNGAALPDHPLPDPLLPDHFLPDPQGFSPPRSN